MKFRHIKNVQISDDGTWVVFASVPDRGDPEGVVRATEGDAVWRIPRGSSPAVAKTGDWAGFIILPPALEVEKAGKDKKKKEKLKNGMVLVNTATGEQVAVERVKSFAFSDDGGWMARLHLKEDKKKDDAKKDDKSEAEKSEGEKGEGEKAGGEKAEGEKKKKAKKKGPKKDKKMGTTLVLRNLGDGSETSVEHVTGYHFDPKSRFLVYAVAAKDGKGDGLYYRDLKGDLSKVHALNAADNTRHPKMAWDKQAGHLAFISRPNTAKEKKKRHRPDGTLHIWSPGKDPYQVQNTPEGMTVSQEGSLRWTLDGQRLFFGLAPTPEPISENDEDEEVDLFDIERIRAKKGLDVWHGDDPRIKTHEKTNWKRERNRTNTAVFHVKKKRVVLLAKGNEFVRPNESPFALVMDRAPYQREATWTGGAIDAYAVDLKSGEAVSVIKGGTQTNRITVAPEGGFLTYYDQGHYYLMDLKTRTRRNLTASLDTPFANELHDYPRDTPGYGYAGWLEDDAAVMIHDRYDIWLFPTNGDRPKRMTRGREQSISYRIVETDPDRISYKMGETVLLDATYQEVKQRQFHEMEIGGDKTRALTEGDKNFKFEVKAKKADVILFTREDFQEFPDLMTADTHLKNARKITNENPQVKDFAWGEPELVTWRSADGKPLEGALYKPGNYEEGKQYPVLVYYYRYFSQRLNQFNQMVVNHRPNFPFYTSNGYAVFLPDIKFEVGYPGHTAVQALIPGIQKIVDMGIADPKAIGLHGHSWSGYQTAFAVTQTDIFACAVSGAPVSNMTSAYSGIRLGSGLARQFQYETGQSRIGANMWERRDLYIDNSPVFFADRINTPMMIMFGDRDDAVPWDQGVELYLAMRRLDKDVVFLQYRDEPHHLKKYPNKVDYTLKMKEYLDHYLKGAPAPKWLREGVPYLGE